MLKQEQNYFKIGRASELKNSCDRRIYRFLEILPGFLSWLTIVLIFIFSWKLPVFAAIFIVFFDTYWLIKTIFLSFHLSHSFKVMKRFQKRNWLEELKQLPKEKYNLKIIDWSEIYHLVILPFTSEGIEVVAPSIESLVNCQYPKNKMIVVLAIEKRMGECAKRVAEEVKEKFGDKFFKFIISEHPADIEGEIAGKGSNEAWAAREAKKVIDEEKISYEKVIVSSFDIDTIVLDGYFACLAYHYLTAKNPLQSSFQPIPIFSNNIWIAPALARVVSFSSTFWQLMQQSRPERLTTFSSHSMPLKALVEIDFWKTNVVSEDSHIFWQCLLHYHGDWKVVPLFYPVYMDANVDKTFWKTIFNQYKQQRRWAYGAENFAFFSFIFLKDSFLFKGKQQFPFKKKLYWFLTILEGAHSWATNSLLIFLLGWLPMILGGTAFNLMLLSFSLPRITRYIMTLASVGIVTSAIMSLNFLPPKPPHYGRWRYILFLVQWVLMPLNLIIFGSFPALDAQTRLMFGKYMGFWVTPKHRK
jgi:hypothetical protein